MAAAGRGLAIDCGIRKKSGTVPNCLAYRIRESGPDTTDSAAAFGTLDLFGLSSGGLGDVLLYVAGSLQRLLLRLEKLASESSPVSSVHEASNVAAAKAAATAATVVNFFHGFFHFGSRISLDSLRFR